VRGWSRGSTNAMIAQAFDKATGDAFDERVGLYVGNGPFVGDPVAVQGIGLHHPGGERQEEGDYRASPGSISSGRKCVGSTMR